MFGFRKIAGFKNETTLIRCQSLSSLTNAPMKVRI